MIRKLLKAINFGGPGRELNPDASLFSLALISVYNDLTGLRWLCTCLKIRERQVEFGLGSWAE
jgi:hypothetical protein